ncbi:MAG: PorT family protein [Treponema sp.]|nr:PorT family protein [Treponema sp.]
MNFILLIKKNILFLFFFIFITGALFATDENDNEETDAIAAASGGAGNTGNYPGLFIGLAAGYTSNNLYTSTAGRSNTEYLDGQGLEFAVPIRYEIFPWLSLQMEVQYIQKNYTWARTGAYNNIYTNVNNNFIDIPVMVNLSAGTEKARVFVNAGGYAGYWITSRTQGTMKEITADPFNGGAYYTNFNEEIRLNETKDAALDAGLLAGIGLQMLNDKYTFFIEGRYYYGLTDMRNKDDYGLIIPRMNSTIDIRFGLFMTVDSLMETLR